MLLVAAGLLQTTMAFRCAVGQYGQCYYYKGSSQDTSRCAIACSYKGVYSQCNCPSNYPNKSSWKYTGRHDCISQSKFDGRNQCQNANPNGRDLGAVEHLDEE